MLSDQVSSAAQTTQQGWLGKGMKNVFSFPVFAGALLTAAAYTVTSAGDPIVPAGKLFFSGDIWWQVAVGKSILATHSWPTTDPYSFTVLGRPWIAYEWLANYVMAVAAQLADLRGLALLLVLLSAVYVLLVFYYAWLRSGNIMSSAVASAALLPLTQAAAVSLRAQLFGYIFLLITLICLERFKQGRIRYLYALPGVFLLWVNTHPSFVLGFFVLVLSWASGLLTLRSRFVVTDQWTPTERRNLTFFSLLSLLATTVTPYGAKLLVHPIEYMLRDTQRHVTEWQPLDWSLPYAKWFLVLIAILILLQTFFPIALRVDVLLLLVFTVVESSLHSRFLVLFPIVFGPILAEHLARWLPSYRPDKDHHLVNAGLIALITWGIFVSFPSEANLHRLLKEEYPVGAVEYLRKNPASTGMFNEVEWGGFLSCVLGTQHKVFIDGRGDIFEYADLVDDYLNMIAPSGNAMELLDKYHIRSCLLHRTAPLSTLLSHSSDWRPVYSDERSVIFTRVTETQTK